VAEYEALLLGLRVAKDIGIKEISMFVDAKLIVNKIRNIYQAKHPRLITYRNEVWDMIGNFFLAFNISFILREENIVVDSLFVSASNFRFPLPPKFRYDIELKYRPSIPDNVNHWKVFEDDIDFKRFLETVEEFSLLHINHDPNSENEPRADVLLKKIANHHIMQLPKNHILKGLFPLERIFDTNNVAVEAKRPIDDVEIFECNIGTKENPKVVKLSSSLSREKRSEYAELLNKFDDVFA